MNRVTKNEETSRQFNATMLIAIVVAAVLALAMLGLVYGCMKANHAPQIKPVAGQSQAAVPWHFLYFLPEPQGQGSLRPTLAEPRTTVWGALVWPAPAMRASSNSRFLRR